MAVSFQCMTKFTTNKKIIIKKIKKLKKRRSIEVDRRNSWRHRKLASEGINLWKIILSKQHLNLGAKVTQKCIGWPV